MTDSCLEGGNREAEPEYFGWGTVAPNIKVKESSIHMSSVWGLQHHHPNMGVLWGHGDQSPQKKITQLIYHLYVPYAVVSDSVL